VSHSTSSSRPSDQTSRIAFDLLAEGVEDREDGSVLGAARRFLGSDDVVERGNRHGLAFDLEGAGRF
jgi:hypothetical protein